MNWAKRNYEYHKGKAESLKHQIEAQSIPFRIFLKYLPKQMKEEQDHVRYFLDTTKTMEQPMHEHLKSYLAIKENLFACALFFHIYTNPYKSFDQAVNEILSRKRKAL